MALYDPTLVTAIHPVTGAPIVMPAAVAAQFPGLQIMQQPQAAMGDGSVHNFADGSVHNLGTAPVVPGDAAQPVDEVAPAPMPASGKPKAATPSAVQPGIGVPQTAMDQAAAAVPNAPPPPVTTADLSNGGLARSVNLQSNATEEQKQAARQQAAAEADQSRQLGNAYADELQRQDDIDKQRVAAAQAKLNQINQKSAQIDSAVDAVSKMRVDNSIAHPLLGAISLVLGGLGAALNHSMDNPALNVLNKQIAQNVQTQMANIGNARAAVGMQQGQLANMRSQFTDQNALYDAMTAAEIRRAQITVNQIAQRSNSDIVKAKAQALIGQLDQQRAQALGSAATQQVAADDRQTGLKLEKRGQDISAYEQGQNRAQAAKFHTDDMDFRAKQLAQQGNLEAAKLLQQQAGLLRDGGMMAPTGKMITVKNPDGTTTTKPEFDWMRQQDGTPWIVNKEAAKELSPYKVRAATDHAVDAIDAVRQLRSATGGDYTNLSTDANEKIAEIQRATMALMQTMGGNASPRSKEILDTIQRQLTGSGNVTDKIKSIMPILDQARRDIITDANSTYVAAGYNGDPVTYTDPVKMPAPSKTAVQQGVQAAIKYQAPAFDPDDPQQRLTGQPSADTVDKAEAPIKSTIDSLAQQMVDPSGTASSRANATDYLGQIIKNAADSSIRAYATNAVMAARSRAPAEKPQPATLTGRYTANRLPQ